jgi:hypothetical protein
MIFNFAASARSARPNGIARSMRARDGAQRLARATKKLLKIF